MAKVEMTTLFITHNDLDAAGSIIVSKLFSLSVTDYMFCGYDGIYDENDDEVVLDIPKTYDRILVTDISCNAKMYKFLKEHCTTLGIFDHHPTTEAIADKPEVFWSSEKSGTEVFYDEIKKGKTAHPKWDQFVHMVSAYDLWKLEHPLREMSEDLNRLFFRILNYNNKGVYGQYKYFIDTQVSKLLDENLLSFEFDDWEQTHIEAAKEKEYKEYLAATKNMQIKVDDLGNKYIIYHGSSKVSIVCSRILAENKDIVYILNFNTYSGSSRKRINGRVSARSTGFDVTTLQGIHGHKEAGGGSFSESKLKRIWYYQNQHLGYKEGSN